MLKPCTPKRSCRLPGGCRGTSPSNTGKEQERRDEKDSEAPGTDEREVKVILGRSPCDFHD